MILSGIRALRSGHWPTLAGAWLHFEVSFMVWLLIGALSIPLSEDFHLSSPQKGLLVGFPLLGGALLRILVGPLSDRLGAKTVGLFILVLEVLALGLAWQWADSFGDILLVGFLLGFAGASFAIALPLASQAYPAEHQGFAMGIAAIGNSGVLVTALMAPRLATIFGWQGVFGLMVIPVILTAACFWSMVREQSSRTRPKPPFWNNGVRDPLLYWLCFLYAVTFGGFVGFSSYLPLYFHDQFAVDMIQAGSLTALCALAGSAARPVGGFWADRLGGLSLLQGVLGCIAFFCVITGFTLSLGGMMGLLICMMAGLGFGNGVIFQVVSSRFQHMMGTASGLIGAAGGLGGFFLPVWFGWLKGLFGTFLAGFWAFGVVVGIAGLSAMIICRTGRLAWQKSHAEQ